MNGDVVFNAEEESDFENYSFSVPSVMLDSLTPATPSGEARKQASIMTFEAQGIPVNQNLPPITGDEHARLRSVEDVVDRVRGGAPPSGQSAGMPVPKER